VSRRYARIRNITVARLGFGVKTERDSEERLSNRLDEPE